MKKSWFKTTTRTLREHPRLGSHENEKANRRNYARSRETMFRSERTQHAPRLWQTCGGRKTPGVIRKIEHRYVSDHFNWMKKNLNKCWKKIYMYITIFRNQRHFFIGKKITKNVYVFKILKQSFIQQKYSKNLNTIFQKFLNIFSFNFSESQFWEETEKYPLCSPPERLISYFCF